MCLRVTWEVEVVYHTPQGAAIFGNKRLSFPQTLEDEIGHFIRVESACFHVSERRRPLGIVLQQGLDPPADLRIENGEDLILPLFPPLLRQAAARLQKCKVPFAFLPQLSDPHVVPRDHF
jgi:hypothetical protein